MSEERKSETYSTEAESAKVRFMRIAMEDLKPWVELMNDNFKRLYPLTQLAGGMEDRKTAEDILRAVVVLQHAYLEDFLRTIAAALLPVGDERCLNGIPLAGLSGRAEKFFLGKLVRHRGRLVDEVLKQSVSEYLDRSNFNSTEEIAELLEMLGFKVEDHNDVFPELSRMIERRHQIVHRADKVKASNSNNYTLQPIEAEEVQSWMEYTRKFMGGLWAPLFMKLNPPESLAKKYNIHITG
jgi:hypothetical protein